MIAKYFIEFIIFICGQFLSILSSALPDNSGLSSLATCVTSILGITTQTTNFLYFIFGDFLYPITILLTFYIPFKFIAVPVFSLVRKFVVWGG